MNRVLKEGMIILSIFIVFVSYLFFAANRFENIENSTKNLSNVTRNISE